MQSSEELRRKRVLARIPGRVVCERAAISRGRLSEIESGYVSPTDEELARIDQALDELIRARQEVVLTAVKVGWPLSAL